MNLMNTDPDWGGADVRTDAQKFCHRADAEIIRQAVTVIKTYGEGQSMTLQMIEDLATRLER